MTVATVNKDNTFSLMRHVWNDVQEDWPFYSEQDKNMLKRYVFTISCCYKFIFVINLLQKYKLLYYIVGGNQKI